MKTYVNNTDELITVSVQIGENTKTHELAPGARFTFDENAGNGPDIESQLQAASATLAQEE